MNWRSHLPRTWILGVLTLLLALAGTSAGAEPELIGRAAAPSPAEVLRRAATLPRGPLQLAELPPAGSSRTLAPYFVVLGQDGLQAEGERLPLEETRADVSIAGPIARVKVTQVFRNRGARPIEALYVFPASTRAAVHGMRLRIGERTVEARIERRAEARAQYEQARTDGKRAALLDEERPNVFTMRVANVMPGDRLLAELDYSELVVPEQGTYELVYPAVVGPRYGGHADPAKDQWIANPTLPEGGSASAGAGGGACPGASGGLGGARPSCPPVKMAFAAHLEAAIPVKELSSPSHALDVSWRSPRSADVAVRGADGGNRDVVLRWRLAGDAVESGVLLFPGEDGDGWFLATLEPPARVRPEALPPREYVFLLDVSGSMHGFPLDTAKALMRHLLPKLRPVDRFNVVFFSGGSYVLSPGESLAASPENVKRALDTFDHLQGAGGTELLQGLQVAYDLPRADRRIARSVVVVTDGYVAVEAQAFRLVRERLAEASCFAFGIGTSVNRALIEGLARAGQGEPTIVLGPKDAGAAADKLERIIASPILSQLRWQAEGFEARDVLPGALPDLLAERPVTLLGRYHGEPRGKIVVTGQAATGAWRRELDLSSAAPRLENSPLRVLWARRWVDLLLDEHHLGPAKELEEAITDLGLAHRLLTPFTSFVAVDSEVVNRGGQGETVKQPLPLPEGVSNLAVGGAAQAKASLAFSRTRGGVAAAPQAMPAAPAPVSAQELEDGLGSGVKEKKEARRDEAPGRKPAPRVAVLKESLRGLASAAAGDALRAAVQARLLELAVQGLRGELELRLTLDGAGAVVKVELLRPADPALRARLEKALRGLQAGAAPADGSASYQLLVRVG